uniref:Histone H2A n=1 Tax=Sus scrofa TaxID=9823 RepID=A0A8W4FFW1_PIG
MSRKRNLPQCSHRKKHALSCSSRAELQFPMSSLDCVLPEGQYAQRLSSYTPVFLAGVLEHLMAHILELAAREARSSRKVRITPEHVQRALNNNETLSRLFQLPWLKNEDVGRTYFKILRSTVTSL